MKKYINIGIIGLGYWGPNLLRNFDSNPDCNVICVSDLKTDRINEFINKYKNIKFTNNSNDIFKNNDIDAVVIATPVKTHFSLAKKAIKNNKHIFIEKPLSDSVKNCQILIKEAAKRSLSLFVDHTFIYTDAVNKMKSISQMKNFGHMLYYDSTRINLGLIQNDINVMWDLAVHDLSILNYIQNNKPTLISAIGHRHFKNKPITSAFITLKYKNNFIAHINVNWLSPVKIRQTILAGSKKMIVYNDLEPSDKLSIFNKGVNIVSNIKNSDHLIKYKIGDTVLPILKNNEPLQAVVEDFILTITKNKKSKSSGIHGMNVVKLLEAADKSIANNGKPILL